MFLFFFLVIISPAKHIVEVLHHTSTIVNISTITFFLIIINIDIILLPHLFQDRLLHSQKFIFSHILEVSVLDQRELLLLLLHHHLLMPWLWLIKLVNHILNLLVSNTTILFIPTTIIHLRLAAHHQLLRVDGRDVICEVRLLQGFVPGQ